jgi:hypothetical protein
MTTFAAFPVERFGRLMRTTGSFEIIRCPSAATAMSGRLSTMPACSRSMPLCTSVCALRRITTTLSSWPVATSVFSRPAASINTVANTYTTSAMPPAVSAVVSLRATMFRAM